jgi:hypothetical protein
LYAGQRSNYQELFRHRCEIVPPEPLHDAGRDTFSIYLINLQTDPF